MVQPVQGSTEDHPMNGTKLLPWLLIECMRPGEAPSTDDLYEELRRGIGDSALHFGVVSFGTVAMVLVHKVKTRALTWPALECQLNVRTMPIVKAACLAVEAWCMLRGSHTTTISLERPKVADQPKKT
jgi:hypothetical protein